MDKFQKMIVLSLRSLGSSPKQVAASLKAKRIKGDPNQPTSCPLANYLKKDFGVNNVSVGTEKIKVNGIEIDTFPLVDRFTTAFDNNKFPELEG